MSAGIPFIDAGSLRRTITDREAVDAIRTALVDDLVDPETESPRTAIALTAGQLLLMPSELGDVAGVKVATVAPANPSLGQPRIQGGYLLFDARLLAPIALLDAAELTLIRTPAVTTFAITEMLRARRATDVVERLVVFGTGPQAERHIRSLAQHVALHDVAVIGRRPEALARLIRTLHDSGIRARAAEGADLRRADVVICATSSSDPVFADDEVAADVIVAAVGAHGLGHREVPEQFVRRASVVVESVQSALSESGNLIPARSEQEWRARGMVTLSDLALRGLESAARGPVLYTGVGMAWEDLAVARQVHRARPTPVGSDPVSG